MIRLFLPLLLASFSFANAQMVTVTCSDGQAQFEMADLRGSKCLRITQDTLINPMYQMNSQYETTEFSLTGIDTRSLNLFIKLSKLSDAKVFAFIDSLNPDEFRIFDYYAKYLRVYHEIDLLFKYKYVKEYSPQGNQAITDFVDSKYTTFQFIEGVGSDAGKWKLVDLFEKYVLEFAGFMKIPTGAAGNDTRAFFVLIDFYQRVIKKPLRLTTQHLKDVFNSFDLALQNELLKKQLVIIP